MRAAVLEQCPGDLVIDDSEGKPLAPMQDGDAVLLLNFRGDRAIEISRAFDEEDFADFDRGKCPDLFFAGLMEYDGDEHIPKSYLVSPPTIEVTSASLQTPVDTAPDSPPAATACAGALL